MSPERLLLLVICSDTLTPLVLQSLSECAGELLEHEGQLLDKGVVRIVAGRWIPLHLSLLRHI